MGKRHLQAYAGGADWESCKLESVGERDTNRTAVGKPRVGMALPESCNASGDTYAAPGSMDGSGAYLKCLYANAHSVRNKQDELEALVSFQSYDIIGTSETWWNVSHKPVCARATMM